MNPIRELRLKASVTQAELADSGGTSQPTIAAYESGRKSPTINTVVRLAASMGLELSIDYCPPMTREERRSLALHVAISRRLAGNPDQCIAIARDNLARMSERSEGSRWLKEWEVLLRRPIDALIPVLTDRDPWARELRHVTPFSGILSPVERTAVYTDFAEAEKAAS